MSINIYLAYDEIDNVRELFVEYIKGLNIKINLQKFENELANLPGKYAMPKGRLYLARYNGNLAGCIAFKPVENNKCELKRLYVRSEYRGHKIGMLLIEALIKDAKNLGYDAIRLDTLATLKEAVALYRKAGFSDTKPYYKNKGALYMSLDLQIQSYVNEGKSIV
jgi:ribosomal protein S18 acetylase RimI-like enzyme